MIGTQLPLKSKSHEMKGKIGEQLRKEAIQVLLTDSEINAYRFCSLRWSLSPTAHRGRTQGVEVIHRSNHCQQSLSPSRLQWA